MIAYQRKGLEGLYDYYNPGHIFDEKVCVSPFEEEIDEIQGIRIMSFDGFDEWKKVINKIKPDIIRAYGGFYSADIMNYFGAEDIPIITSLHDVAKISPSILKSDRIFCMSNVVKEKAIEIGANSDKIRILPNRVDLNIFNNKKEKTRGFWHNGGSLAP